MVGRRVCRRFPFRDVLKMLSPMLQGQNNVESSRLCAGGQGTESHHEDLSLC